MMGHLNYDEQGKAIARVGKRMLFLSDKPVEGGFDTVAPKGDAVIQQLPDKDAERSVLYISAPSGAGKSYYTREYIAEYRKIYPKRDVFVFSSLDDDPTLDKLKYLKRIKIRKPEFLTTELSVDMFKDSLVVMDDVDVIADRKIKLKVFQLLNTLLQVGRHENVSVVYTSHMACNGAETRIILAECHSLTTFPKNIGGKAARYLYDNYLGLDKTEIKSLKSVQGRHVTILKSFPMVALSEGRAWVLRT